MVTLAFQVVEVTATKVAEKAGVTLVESSVLGALLLLSVGVNLLLIRKLLQVQDKRVTDKETDNLRLTQLTLTTSETVSKVALAISALEQSDKSSANVLQALKSNLDMLLAQAMMRSGMTPSAGLRRPTDREGAER
jgi:hypothetical protein